MKRVDRRLTPEEFKKFESALSAFSTSMWEMQLDLREVRFGTPPILPVQVITGHEEPCKCGAGSIHVEGFTIPACDTAVPGTMLHLDAADIWLGPYMPEEH